MFKKVTPSPKSLDSPAEILSTVHCNPTTQPSNKTMKTICCHSIPVHKMGEPFSTARDPLWTAQPLGADASGEPAIGRPPGHQDTPPAAIATPERCVVVSCTDIYSCTDAAQIVLPCRILKADGSVLEQYWGKEFTPTAVERAEGITSCYVSSNGNCFHRLACWCAFCE